MARRRLYLAAYDVRDPGRLRRAHRVLRDYSTGGQKSVFECFLTERERKDLLRRVEGVMELEEDRFFLLPLDARAKTRTLGRGEAPSDAPVFFVT